MDTIVGHWIHICFMRAIKQWELRRMIGLED